MFDDIHILPAIKGRILDYYLAFGWYRWGRYIFTVHTLAPHGPDKVYPVFWLRYQVGNVRLSSSARKIIAACSRFSVEVKPFRMTDELTDLHSRYVGSLKFETHTELRALLNDTTNEVYDTFMIEVRDGGRLIGAGIFDLGYEAIAGIINIYDPELKQYSLGKFLILQKYLFCLNNGLPCYYPGYFSTEYPVFDYKLFLDKAATEVYVPATHNWISFHQFMQERG